MTPLTKTDASQSGPPQDGAVTDPAVRLRAEHVRLAYGERTVVEGLDLDVVAGTITAVIGPNGCGKSTLLRALGRLLKPTAGQPMSSAVIREGWIIGDW